MTELRDIPKPHLDARHLGARRIPALVDEELARTTGVRIAFTGRAGGVSKPPYDALNLGSHVGDDRAVVDANRAMVLEAMGVPAAKLVVPNQVHGTNGVQIASCDQESISRAAAQAAEGADYLTVEAADVAAMLCFADCVPVIVVSPTGRFAVAHAGWRGAVARIASMAVFSLVQLDQQDLGADAACRYNAYIGPHIRSECFECGAEVIQAFRHEFGEAAIADSCHVDLSAAVSFDLQSAGMRLDRIADAGICTRCRSEEFYSYRASGGTCGRHAAVAVRASRAREMDEMLAHYRAK